MSAEFYPEEVKFHVAVDCIVFGFYDNELYVLLYRRSLEPQKGQWSLTGGFVKWSESLDEAASRVLTECTGIEHIYMEQIGAYGDATRNLGERVISVAYYALVSMKDFDMVSLNEDSAIWTKLSEMPALIFNHNQTVGDAICILRQKAAIQPVGFNLLPEKFTLPQLQCLYEAIYQRDLDKRNFRKKLNSMNLLEKLNEKDKKSSKRGAFYYQFNKEKYDNRIKDGFYFSL